MKGKYKKNFRKFGLFQIFQVGLLFMIFYSSFFCFFLGKNTNCEQEKKIKMIAFKILTFSFLPRLKNYRVLKNESILWLHYLKLYFVKSVEKITLRSEK